MKNVPDYRGVFLRGLGGNSAALGELQNYALVEHVHEITMPASHGKPGKVVFPGLVMVMYGLIIKLN